MSDEIDVLKLVTGRLDSAGHPVWIVSAEDLLRSKLVWASSSHSEVQLRDVRNLIESAELDWASVDTWAADLGVAALLGEVRP